MSANHKFWYKQKTLSNQYYLRWRPHRGFEVPKTLSEDYWTFQGSGQHSSKHQDVTWNHLAGHWRSSSIFNQIKIVSKLKNMLKCIERLTWSGVPWYMYITTWSKAASLSGPNGIYQLVKIASCASLICVWCIYCYCYYRFILIY